MSDSVAVLRSLPKGSRVIAGTYQSEEWERRGWLGLMRYPITVARPHEWYRVDDGWKSWSPDTGVWATHDAEHLSRLGDVRVTFRAEPAPCGCKCEAPSPAAKSVDA